MKPLPKLKRYITVYMGLVFLVVIAAYTALVYYSLLAGIVEAAAYDLRLAAREYAAQYENDPHTPLPEAPRVSAYLGPAGLPPWFKSTFLSQAQGHDEILIEELEPAQSGLEEYIFFINLSYTLDDGNTLFLIKIYKEADDIPEAFRYCELTESLALSFGIGFIILIFLVIRFLFKKVAGSVLLLSDWAGSLTPRTLESPRPGFRFREIDELGMLIQDAVADLHNALNREHRFLRHASHELRTPIAVLRSNMDLLARLNPAPEKKEKMVYQRMGRALDNMHSLTETLLWLARKEQAMPASEPIDMVGLMDELVRENRYLLDGKPVELLLETAPSTACFPEAACRIAIGNLVRNAFQYTAQGKIIIQVTADAILIANDCAHDPLPQTQEYGFGLGLSLVEQICARLGLAYEKQDVDGGHRATISWK